MTAFIGFPPFGVKPVKPDGSWTEAWYLFLHEQYLRNGGSSAPSNDQLAVLAGRAAPIYMEPESEGFDGCLIPGPAGQRGLTGQPGPAQFLTEEGECPYSAAISMRKP